MNAREPDLAARGVRSRNLLSRDLMARLEALAIATKRRFAGRSAGERLSRRRGAGIEFADYRDYSPGDDLRALDWNVAGRLDRWLIRTFTEEEDLDVTLLVDSSASMGFGTPSKLDHALRLAAALGYVGLAGLDRVRVVAFDAQRCSASAGVRGKPGIFQLLEHLGGIEARGMTDLATALRRLALSARRPGLAVVLSDLFDPAGYRDGCDRLLSRGFGLVVLHVLAPEDLAPPLAGDLLLVDSETSATTEVSLSPALLARYAEVVGAFQAEVREFLAARGASYLAVTTAVPVEDVVLKTMRHLGLVG
jgi:uncharacterized protein (DUF58 family)